MIDLLFFLLITIGFGGLVSFMLGKNIDVESMLMWIPVGLAVFVIATCFFGQIAAIGMWSYIWLVLVMIVISLIIHKKVTAKFELDIGWIATMLIFVIYAYVYISGAFSYPLLEDDDSWQHAAGVRYISEFQTFMQPEPRLIHYLSPYPPFYDVLMATLFDAGKGTGATILTTLKFYNGLLCGLVIPLFYAWSRNRFGKDIGLWSTFILAIVPAFMSHFIWSQTLAFVFVFPIFYFLDKWNENKQNSDAILCIMVFTAMLITQPSVAAIIFVMVLIYQLPTLLNGKWKQALLLPAISLAMALLVFWGPMFIIYGVGTVAQHISFVPDFLTGDTIDTGGGLVYGIEDIINTPIVSRMDQPTGFGLVVFAFLVIGFITILEEMNKELKGRHIILMLWLLFGIIGLEANALPIKMMPHRFWVFLAIPVSIIAAIGIEIVLRYFETFNIPFQNGRIMSIDGSVAIVIVIAMLITSGAAKYTINTSSWPPGVNFVAAEQYAGYVALKQLPANTKVFSMCGDEDLANGIGLYGYSWVKEVKDYKNKSVTNTLQVSMDFLHRYNYSYVFIDQTCLLYFTPQQIIDKVNQFANDDVHFRDRQELISNGFIVFEVIK